MPDDIEVTIRAEGVEEAGRQIEETGEELEAMDGAEVGTADGDGAIIPLIKRMIGPLVALVAIAAILQDTLRVVGQVLNAFVRPLSAMLLRLFAPVLRWFLRLLPFWMEFLQDPLGALERLFAWGIAELVDALDALPFVGEPLSEFIESVSLSTLVLGTVSLPLRLKGFVIFADRILGGIDIRDRVFGFIDIRDFIGGLGGHDERPIGPGPRNRDITREGNQPIRRVTGDTSVNIMLGGGLAALVEQIERDRTLEFP